ncbi:MAG: dihydroxyacetone kinase subunit L [Methylococcaceae bacterium]|nr:dihydroxyacetone kinase subunit L [Methylococcaceae bacterium]
MSLTPVLFPELINAVTETIAAHAEAVTELDQAIGDGDHVFNLQRGLQALQAGNADIAVLDWPAAWQKIGMILMSAVGGASGSLYATLFISLNKNSHDKTIDLQNFASIFGLAVDAVKQRGKADVGEKTMLDVLVPVAEALKQDAAAGKPLPEVLDHVCAVAEAGVESTRNMLATKGRASFLGERSIGHIDAGAKTAQLMIEAVAGVLKKAA